MIDDDSEYFLSHHGVKGMKWGVRKKRPLGGKKEKTPAQKEASARRKKILIDGVILGVGIAAVILANQPRTSVSTVRSSPSTKLGENKVASLFGQGAGQARVRMKPGERVFEMPASSIPHAPAKPKGQMSKETQDFLKAFDSKQQRLNREANADLRKRDNELNIPMSQRSYLPENWD